MAFIELEHLSVDVPLFHSRSLKQQILRAGVGGKMEKNDRNTLHIKALDQVSCRIFDGDRVGVIGHNGAGKSTLLRVLSRIYEPTQGRLYIDGKVSCILDVAFGMSPESTGYENILTRGILFGLTREVIQAKMAEIAAFTGLGDYLSVPIRTYSSGMQLRLAFGVATAIQPEILVLDEIVGVGDAAFMEKAKRRCYELIDQSRIVVLSSHSFEIIRELCNKVMLLEGGRLTFFGDVETGISKYLAFVHEAERAAAPPIP